MNGTCRLTGKPAELLESHILPKFVFRHLRKSSPAQGHMRVASEPNRRVQDGEKRYLLSREAEARFNNWETPFANEIFYPYHQRASEAPFRLVYDVWAHKFAVSVVWRILVTHLERGMSHLPFKLRREARRAEFVWRKYLLGKRSDVRHHRIHMLPLGPIESQTQGYLSPYINRYLMRCTDTDSPANHRTCYIYAKLLEILIIGEVRCSKEHDWVGTEIQQDGGVFEARLFEVPGWLHQFINQKADTVFEALESMSTKQSDKIGEIQRQHAEEVIQSPGWEAMCHDVAWNGSGAFSGQKTDD